eukprot:CAMPEP_0172744584 /NCGR_PEP_ID=MMETSP1074-20121228/135637_1 /TAXON_ID=2916 /ORGANISM="Ceratium fusus, Strain PA161109" /LENGTH=154 /DNA_ID=CAMNT_0013575571 /DNA_START=95 /DNA_END=556 /DNA_ORIENTATION=-
MDAAKEQDPLMEAILSTIYTKGLPWLEEDKELNGKIQSEKSDCATPTCFPGFAPKALQQATCEDAGDAATCAASSELAPLRRSQSSSEPYREGPPLGTAVPSSASDPPASVLAATQIEAAKPSTVISPKPPDGATEHFKAAGTPLREPAPLAAA